MNKQQEWTCTNPECKRKISLRHRIAGTTVCDCGAAMKKPYWPPRFSRLRSESTEYARQLFSLTRSS
jgi:hypothetical protein